MKQLEGYMSFWPEYKTNQKIQASDYCLIYNDKRIIGKVHKGKITIPSYEEVNKWVDHPEKLWYLGKWEDTPCFAYQLEISKTSKEQIEEEKITYILEDIEQELQERGLEWIAYEDSRWNETLELHFVAIKTQHLLNWDKSTQFCGYCGKPYSRKEDERAKMCINCGSIQYPRISPAIIVGIKKGEQVLLAHNANFKEGLYSIIAGFVEQGETLEHAVKREIYEEVGLKVKNIRYVQSRPWISLDSLMLGFIAEYESGEVKVDGKEILDAGWYDKNHLPPLLPEKITTARCIIDEILGFED